MDKARLAFANVVAARNVFNRFAARVGMEHDSPEALQKYLKEHPDADKSKHTVKKPEKDEGGKAGDKGGTGSKKWLVPRSFQKVNKARHEAQKIEKTIGEIGNKLWKAVGAKKVSQSDVENVFNKGKDAHKKAIEHATSMKKAMDEYLDKVGDVVIEDQRTLDLVASVRSYSKSLQKAIDAQSKVTEDADVGKLWDEGREGVNNGKENKWYHPMSRKMDDIVESTNEVLKAIENAATHMYEIENKT